MDTPTTTTTREQLAEFLTELLPADIRIRKSPQELDALPASVRAAVVLHRRRVAPRGSAGYLETFDAWVLVEFGKSADTTEDALDRALDDVLEAIAGHEGVAFEAAERDQFDTTRPAYRIELVLASNKERTE